MSENIIFLYNYENRRNRWKRIIHVKKKIYILLYNISLLLRDTKAGKLVYDIFEELGIRILISRFFNKLEVRNNYFHPNKQMEKSRFFFESNKERINTITGWLSDDISKQVYTSMIKFRQTSNYSDLPPNSMKEQYFDNNFFTYKNGEVFVDCGSYDGDSIRLFKKNMKKRDISQYTIIGFEPDAHNFKNLKRNYPTITVSNAGVWSVDTELFFNSNQNITAANIVSGDQLLRVRSLDNCNEVQQATLIKMDIDSKYSLKVIYDSYYFEREWKDEKQDTYDWNIEYKIQYILYRWFPKWLSSFLGMLMQRLFI